MAAEFVMMLRRRYVERKSVTEPKSALTDWTKLEAFGIWADRPEMEDSVAYVRERRGHKNTWADRTEI